MQRNQISELHNIQLVENISSVLQNGVLSHKLASKINHKSCAMPEIQSIRANKVVPNGRPLHEYANLYFHARNPMMYKLLNGYCIPHSELVIMKVDTSILDASNVVLTDGNAATEWVRFYPSPDGLSSLNYDLIFSRNWNDNNPIIKSEKKTRKCSEILVPDKADISYITGIYVSCDETLKIIKNITLTAHSNISLTVNSDLFFH